MDRTGAFVEPGGRRFAGPIRRLVAVAPGRLRIERRRCGSWLAVASAAGLMAWLPALPDATRLPAAILAGAGCVVMAIGAPPRLVASPVGETVALRAAWPLAGVLAGGLIAGARGAEAAAGVGCLAAGAAALTFAQWLRRGGTAVESSTATLVIAVATAGAVAAAQGAGMPLRVLVAVGAWLGLCMAGFAWPAVQPYGWNGAGEGAGSSAGRGLMAAAMLSSLAGMVTWLFLAPERSGWYLALAAGWFVALAVPEATLSVGLSRSGGRRRLLDATPDMPAGGPGRAARTMRHAWRLWLDTWRPAATGAAILGWPPLVAAALSPAPGPALMLAAVIGSWAAILTSVATVSLAAGLSRETAYAGGLMLALVAAFAALHAGVGG